MLLVNSFLPLAKIFLISSVCSSEKCVSHCACERMEQEKKRRLTRLASSKMSTHEPRIPHSTRTRKGTGPYLAVLEAGACLLLSHVPRVPPSCTYFPLGWYSRRWRRVRKTQSRDAHFKPIYVRVTKNNFPRASPCKQGGKEALNSASSSAFPRSDTGLPTQVHPPHPVNKSDSDSASASNIIPPR